MNDRRRRLGIAIVMNRAGFVGSHFKNGGRMTGIERNILSENLWIEMLWEDYKQSYRRYQN
jgi:hypothetical protein